MRLVKYTLLFLLTLFVGIYIFMPKTHLYYKAEELLQQKSIVIGNEKIESDLRSFRLLHPVIYFQGADLARIEAVEIKPYILINSVKFVNIEPLGVAKEFGDITIESLDMKHSLLKPFYIKVDSNGSFGVAQGFIDLKNRFVHIDITKPKKIQPLKRVLKKGEKGWYYESKF